MNDQIKTQTLNQVIEGIDNLFEKRNGGSINYRGIHYQLLYACYLVLSELKDEKGSKSVTMEGIEDIDVHSSQIIHAGNEYIQLKSSINKMDAGTFWNLGTLQNFIEAYLISPDNKFKLVYNMKIAEGNLSSLINKNATQKVSEFWVDKVRTINTNIDYDDFFTKISFEFQSSNELYRKILILLFKEWNINRGTESQFLRSLFYNVLIWSKNRSTIKYLDVHLLFQDIRDSYSKAPINKATQNNWIEKVSYDKKGNNPEDYYDGKAATPIHISLGLPARRKLWEKTIQQNINNSDVTVIKSSSGQGKSTLAWQVGFNLKENFNVYQLHSCRDSGEANSVAEFLESRFLIGENPLLIIDGLNSSLSFWSEIVQKTRKWPTKYLITTREEDWFRFGADISRINLLTVELSLAIQEAKDIFEQFKRKRKIHPDIKEWQPVWELVQSKGLLIEYTYLLTKGQMIHERLSSQLNYLGNSKSSGAKIEILRMTSLADCLGIRLKTTNLINYIKLEIGFDQDRGQILNELEKEYFLNFEGTHITGLHPVRSNHLKDLLHTNLQIEDSLIQLFKITDEEFKRDYFINAPLFINIKNKEVFYEHLAEVLFESKFSDMVFALDGIMHGEPERYWNENKRHFDEAYNVGGIDLFSMVTVPFASLNTLEDLTEIMGDNGANFRYLADIKKKLPTYTFENTDLLVFANALKNKLKKRTLSNHSYEGLEFLIKWFNALNLPINSLYVNSEIQIDELINMEIEEAKELMLCFQISKPQDYKDFINKHRGVIISYLKVYTDSLVIEEQEESVHIQYLLLDKDADQANENSMSRIRMVHAFLPFFTKYCTEAILLPFPSEEIVSVVHQNSVKHISPEVIGNRFDIHLNKIWLSTIEKKYQAPSAFYWQKSILDLRKIALQWSKLFIRVIDALLEGNDSKRKKACESLDNIRLQLSSAISLKKAYPQYEKKYFEKEDYAHNEKTINSWLASLANINKQLLNIFVPSQENDRNIALINLKSVFLDLSKMQNAFKVIEIKTVAYFDLKDLCEDECKYFERLYTTVLYYISEIPLQNKKAVSVAKKAVEEWWGLEKNLIQRTLEQILSNLEKESDYKFVLPNYLVETNTLTYCSFGILNFDFTDADAFFKLSIDLSPLANLDCDFFSIISIDNGYAVGGLQLKNNYLKAFTKLLNGEENISMEGLTPLPIYLDENSLVTLPNIKLLDASATKQEIDREVEILQDLWKLSEFRNRLDKNSKLERQWLETNDLKLTSNIKNGLRELTKASIELKDFVSFGLQPDSVINNEDIVSQIFKSLLTRT